MKPGNIRPYRAVLFDFDDTLIDTREALTRVSEHWYATRPRENRPPTEEEFIAGLQVTNSEQLSLRDFYVRMLEIWPGCFPSVEAALEAHSVAVPDCVSVDRGTEVMLRDLKVAGVPVGVVTNGPTEMQWAKVRNAGVADLVRAVVVSEEFGANKPDPAIFHHALSLIGASPAETLFVGDNTVADIGGASGIGMRTAWMSHGRSWVIDSYSPDHVVDDVWDVRPLLGI
ncbi:MAG: HAD family hydrolase [Dehalococcoidia bacterium]|nr:HAD family hydrolase [Dehalococcoidia bacterium]